jgi:hypothetical protein
VRNVDPVFKNASREAKAALLLFAGSFVWVLGVAAWKGYGRKDVEFIWGFPDWVFWGIALPWLAGLLASLAFGLKFMKDDDLGPEKREGVDD